MYFLLAKWGFFRSFSRHFEMFSLLSLQQIRSIVQLVEPIEKLIRQRSHWSQDHFSTKQAIWEYYVFVYLIKRNFLIQIEYRLFDNDINFAPVNIDVTGQILCIDIGQNISWLLSSNHTKTEIPSDWISRPCTMPEKDLNERFCILDCHIEW